MAHRIEEYAISMVTKLRKSHNMTQKALGKIIGKSASFIGNVESTAHSAKYNFVHLNAIALHWQVSPRIFLPKMPFPEL